MPHPYISGAGNLASMINQLRKNFPVTVTSETVKKFAIAPNNESSIINALQFIGAIDGDGKRIEHARDVFIKPDPDFQTAFSEMVEKAYSDLFAQYGEHAWSLDKPQLTTFFRGSDKTSETIGNRQSAVFIILRGLAGHEPLANKLTSTSQSVSKATPQQKRPKNTPKGKVNEQSLVPEMANTNDNKGIALTVRVEINLPSGGTKDTYDAIFKSIKENLING